MKWRFIYTYMNLNLLRRNMDTNINNLTHRTLLTTTFDLWILNINNLI
jgi:hypothetical protein